MTLDEARTAAYVDAMSTVLGLPLAPEHWPGVVRYFGLAAEMAALVNGLPLGMLDEPAEAFIPISPEDMA
jgi:hypothetical protein